jgi:hypothetical protein
VKKWCIFVLFFVGLLLLSSCGGSSPTAPDPPAAKPQATYTGSWTQLAGWYYPSLGVVSFNWGYTVTNTNGIGATVLRVETFAYHDGVKYQGHTWSPTGTARIEGNQTYTWSFNFDTYTWPGYKYNSGQFMMYVKDDNGYDIVIYDPNPKTITWMN